MKTPRLGRAGAHPWVATASIIASVVAIGACGATHHNVVTNSQAGACTAVADVLSDGPDPGADPVGYAQAQVLPLRQLSISPAGLRSAVDKLASAYQAYASAKAGSEAQAAAKARVSSAQNALNQICPGAAQ